ncbi:MAG: hypothetical protein KJZ96_00145 [Rhodocyclaceae bacterium]|nr:hypothetical protein [Rhodocyclaceae bacterium]
MIAVALVGALALAGPLLAQERQYRTVESGRLESVSVTPLSVTIDGRVYSVTAETHLRGRALVGEPNTVASTLRSVVGRSVGYDWYQDPGQRPVVTTIMPFTEEQ